MKYRICIDRTDFQTHEFIVEAPTVEEAEEEAYEQACNIVWRRGNAEYSTESIEEIKDDG